MGTAPVAIITKAGSGIGHATIIALVQAGDIVLGLDIDSVGLAETGRRAPAARYRYHARDITDFAKVDKIMSEMLSDYEQVHSLVNNAGVGVAATVPETLIDDWNWVMQTNLSATSYLCCLLIPHMIAAGGGTIVNAAFVAGAMVVVADRAAYCASKTGVVGLTRAIAPDHAAEGIRANAICIGTVASEWIEKILADSPDPATRRLAMEARQLDGLMGSPDEIAAGILFFASPETQFVSGSAMVIDGGLTAVCFPQNETLYSSPLDE